MVDVDEVHIGFKNLELFIFLRKTKKANSILNLPHLWKKAP